MPRARLASPPPAPERMTDNRNVDVLVTAIQAGCEAIANELRLLREALWDVGNFLEEVGKELREGNK